MMSVAVVAMVAVMPSPGDLVLWHRDLISVLNLLGDLVRILGIIVALEPLGQPSLVAVVEATTTSTPTVTAMAAMTTVTTISPVASVASVTAAGTSRQDLGALREAVDVVDAQQTKADVLSGIVLFHCCQFSIFASP